MSYNSQMSQIITNRKHCTNCLILPDQALRVLEYNQTASVMMDCGRRLLREVYDAQLQISRLANKAAGVRKSVDLFPDIFSAFCKRLY